MWRLVSHRRRKLLPHKSQENGFVPRVQNYVEVCQLLHDSAMQLESNLTVALQEKDKLTELFISEEQEINQLQESMHQQKLQNIKQVEQLNYLLKEEQAQALREATGLEEAKKAKVRLEKKCQEESKQQSVQLDARSKLLLASSEQCSQLLLAHTRLVGELTVSSANIDSLAKVKQQTESENSEQLAGSTTDLDVSTRVLQERDGDLQVLQVEIAQLEQEDATALQHFHILESELETTLTELEQLRAQDMELMAALEGAERAQTAVQLELQVTKTEIPALESAVEELSTQLAMLQTNTEMIGSQLHQERTRSTLDQESYSTQIQELQDLLQQKQLHLLALQESLHLHQEEGRKTEEQSKLNHQRISQLQVQVLYIQAEKQAALKVTGDLSVTITELNQAKVILESNVAQANKKLTEMSRQLTEEMHLLEEEWAQFKVAGTEWSSLREKKRDETSQCIERNREQHKEVHQARSLTREYKYWKSSEASLQEQTWMTLEQELQDKAKEDQGQEARLSNSERKLTLLHIEKENSEANLLHQKKELEGQIKVMEMLGVPTVLTSSPLVSLNSQGMPQTPYKSILKPEGQARTNHTKHVVFYESDVSSSSMDIDPQEMRRHTTKCDNKRKLFGMRIPTKNYNSNPSKQELTSHSQDYLDHRKPLRASKLSDKPGPQFPKLTEPEKVISPTLRLQ